MPPDTQQEKLSSLHAADIDFAGADEVRLSGPCVLPPVSSRDFCCEATRSHVFVPRSYMCGRTRPTPSTCLAARGNERGYTGVLSRGPLGVKSSPETPYRGVAASQCRHAPRLADGTSVAISDEACDPTLCQDDAVWSSLMSTSARKSAKNARFRLQHRLKRPSRKLRKEQRSQLRHWLNMPLRRLRGNQGPWATSAKGLCARFPWRHRLRKIPVATSA